MRIKADWLPWLHEFRRRELQLVFSRCPDRLFRTALELGGGDGFQSTLLTTYVERLVCTDFDVAKLPTGHSEGITYRVCDAERVDEVFEAREFALVYSSNLLEHVPDVSRALQAIHRVLADDGITIHIMPSAFWKMCQILLHPANQIVMFLERVTEPGGVKWLVRRLTGRPDPLPSGDGSRSLPLGNNPKTARPAISRLRRLLVPEPHGVSPRNLQEFRAFSRTRWCNEFTRAGFRVLAVRKGPVASGYGFGFERLRRVLERLGATSEYVYVAVKQGATSPYATYLVGPADR
jgi:SAM-dependent methyltransferase